jgi:hypothetical protein
MSNLQVMPVPSDGSTVSDCPDSRKLSFQLSRPDAGTLNRERLKVSETQSLWLVPCLMR